MEPPQVDSLVQRLIANPHDEEALSKAHQAGASDPKSYALLLERVGGETRDPAYASHWLSEAANVWSTTLGDAHRAARVLMQAIDRDPTASTAAERLAQLYRDKGDVTALVALLERRVKALAPLADENPGIRGELIAMHEELAPLWGEGLQQPKKAAENQRRAFELDPSRGTAPQSPSDSRRPAPEPRNHVTEEDVDPQRRVAALRERAAAHRAVGDRASATHALAAARQLDERDPGLQQEYGALIVERLATGEDVPPHERTMGAELLVGLAEVYDGEHGLAYSAGALDIDAGHDRALQLYAYYARALQREDDVAVRYLAYLQVNPAGPIAADARWLLAASYEAARQPENAIRTLEPLRALGDVQSAAKLKELYGQLGQPMPMTSPAAAPQARSPGGLLPTRGAGGGPADGVQTVFDAAQTFAARGMRAEALKKYREVLSLDPSHPEALSWVEDHLRTRRDYAALRDILLASARAPGQSVEGRKKRLREVAGLCESMLRDTDGAIHAWRELVAIDHGDEAARLSLTRMLERAQRWDDLANLVQQEAGGEQDLEKRIALEKKLATLHEQKRRDHVAAAEAWSRIAGLTPEDDRAVATASKLFEHARMANRAAQVIADHLSAIQDPLARGALLERLGRLREQLKELAEAGEAYGAAAELQKSDKVWESAERCFVGAERWERAAQSAVERAHLASTPKLQAHAFARAAEHFARAGDEAGVFATLERATDLDPTSDEHAVALSGRYAAAAKWAELARLLITRGDRLTDKAKRIGVRRQAAKLFSAELSDQESARETWWKVLEDGDDQEALDRLVEDAVVRDDAAEATSLLRRLGKLATHPADRMRLALREAELLAEGVGDIDAAIARYEGILGDIDPTCRPALQAIADLQEARENPAAAVAALERELKLVSDAVERVPIAWRLVRLYEKLDDPKSAIRALELVRESDRDDFDALARLCVLCESTEQWGKTAELLAQRIEVEADETETASLTKKLSAMLADKLDRGDEALAVLTELADVGDEGIREAYVTLGDRLGWHGIVATKLVEWWFDAEPSLERNANLRGAFDRFVGVGREEDAVRVGCEIAKGKGADRALAERLELLSLKARDLDALAVAHDLLVRDMSGMDRARELVRQAEARFAAGAVPLDAVQHGEAGLTAVAPGDAEGLLQRLAVVAAEPGEVVDLYERQITRSRAPADRVRALARAAQVATAKGQPERARGFFDLALSGTPSDEMVSELEHAARNADGNAGQEQLRRILCAAMASGGQGARDGGKTRGALLRRAAFIVHRELGDVDRAFAWLGDALIAHVDATTLDAVEELAGEVGDPERAEATLSRALGEVFDGPLVRQLLARRAKIRRDGLGDKSGAALDLKKLHELSPGDHAVTDEVIALLTSLGDFRSMVSLYEDLILRGKDLAIRADLARKVALMWEQELDDPREAADAWRRVLRMKAGDPEATHGLERAKANMLRRPDPSLGVDVPPPPPKQRPSEPGSSYGAGDEGSESPSPGVSLGPAESTARPKKRRSKRRSTADREVEAPPAPNTPIETVGDAGSAQGHAEKPATSEESIRPSGSVTLDLSLSDASAIESDVPMTDDLAEIIDVDDESGAAADDSSSKPKRSVPPPLPRGSS